MCLALRPAVRVPTVLPCAARNVALRLTRGGRSPNTGRGGATGSASCCRSVPPAQRVSSDIESRNSTIEPPSRPMPRSAPRPARQPDPNLAHAGLHGEHLFLASSASAALIWTCPRPSSRDPALTARLRRARSVLVWQLRVRRRTRIRSGNGWAGCGVGAGARSGLGFGDMRKVEVNDDPRAASVRPHTISRLSPNEQRLLLAYAGFAYPSADSG